MSTKKSSKVSSSSESAKTFSSQTASEVMIDHSKDILLLTSSLSESEQKVAMLSKELDMLKKEMAELKKELSDVKKEVVSHSHEAVKEDKASESKDEDLRTALLRWNPKLSRFIK